MGSATAGVTDFCALSSISLAFACSNSTIVRSSSAMRAAANASLSARCQSCPPSSAVLSCPSDCFMATSKASGPVRDEVWLTPESKSGEGVLTTFATATGRGGLLGRGGKDVCFGAKGGKGIMTFLLSSMLSSETCRASSVPSSAGGLICSTFAVVEGSTSIGVGPFGGDGVGAGSIKVGLSPSSPGLSPSSHGFGDCSIKAGRLGSSASGIGTSGITTGSTFTTGEEI
mmetsp:Transcript_7293/g.18503  ORF Transcript_7293/g.18503 Transcript_7293/m.18503 type:complete len:229 (+) Transcript_7293:473-1159(+)